MTPWAHARSGEFCFLKVCALVYLPHYTKGSRGPEVQGQSRLAGFGELCLRFLFRLAHFRFLFEHWRGPF